ncbi:hypothetical protein F0U62_30495 [Cystobacter fuscus]|nr:hypothetical protein F0U62_30495 [Cystobacter fuscus]
MAAQFRRPPIESLRRAYGPEKTGPVLRTWNSHCPTGRRSCAQGDDARHRHAVARPTPVSPLPSSSTVVADDARDALRLLTGGGEDLGEGLEADGQARPRTLLAAREARALLVTLQREDAHPADARARPDVDAQLARDRIARPIMDGGDRERPRLAVVEDVRVDGDERRVAVHLRHDAAVDEALAAQLGLLLRRRRRCVEHHEADGCCRPTVAHVCRPPSKRRRGWDRGDAITRQAPCGVCPGCRGLDSAADAACATRRSTSARLRAMTASRPSRRG